MGEFYERGFWPCVTCTHQCHKIHGELHEQAKKGSNTYPYFIKTLVRGCLHDAINSSISIPSAFLEHFPDSWETNNLMGLEGPSGNIWVVRARNRKNSSFTAGWRAFAYDHHLHEGDQLHFTLVKKSHFVVEIFNKYGGIRQSARTATKSGIFAYSPTCLPSLVESGKRRREEYYERNPGPSATVPRRCKITSRISEYGETTLGFSKLVPGLRKGKEVITILDSGDEEEKEKSFMSEELRKKLSFGSVHVQNYRSSKIERLMEYMRIEGRNMPEKLQLPKHEVKEDKEEQNTAAEMHEAQHCKRNGDVANVIYEADEENEEDTSREEEYDNPLHKFTKMFDKVSKTSQKGKGVVKVATVEKQNVGFLGSMQPACCCVPSEIMMKDSLGGLRVEEDKVGADSIQPTHEFEKEDTAMRRVNDYITREKETELPLSSYELELENSLKILGGSNAAPNEEKITLREAYKLGFIYESSKSGNNHITPQLEEISMQPTYRGSETDTVNSNKHPLTKTSLLQYDSEETMDEMKWQVISNHKKVSDDLLQLASIACDADTSRANCVQDMNPASNDPPKLVRQSTDNVTELQANGVDDFDFSICRDESLPNCSSDTPEDDRTYTDPSNNVSQPNPIEVHGHEGGLKEMNAHKSYGKANICEPPSRTDCTEHESGNVTVLTKQSPTKQSRDGNEMTASNVNDVHGSMQVEVTVQGMNRSVIPIKDDPHAIQDDGNAKGMIQIPKKLNSSFTYAEVDQNLHIHSGWRNSTGTVEASSHLGQDEDTGKGVDGGAMAEQEKLLRGLPDLSLEANGKESRRPHIGHGERAGHQSRSSVYKELKNPKLLAIMTAYDAQI